MTSESQQPKHAMHIHYINGFRLFPGESRDQVLLTMVPAPVKDMKVQKMPLLRAN